MILLLNKKFDVKNINLIRIGLQNFIQINLDAEIYCHIGANDNLLMIFFQVFIAK
jgi:hypothetical protein